MLHQLCPQPSLVTVEQPSATPVRTVARWMPTFLGFPAGGLATSLLVGRIDGVVPALVGGALSGTILGLVQTFGWRRREARRLTWSLATASGFAAGLAVGAAAAGYGTGLGALAAQGAVTGLAVGAAQAAVLRREVGRAVAAAWPLLLAGLWALGWIITSIVGVDVERQYSVFGSSGALVVTAVTAVLPLWTERVATRRSGR